MVKRRALLAAAGGLLLLFAGLPRGLSWDYEGHRLVNQLALASLPADFHSFVRTPETQERVTFLSGEPDRWRNTPDLPLKHFNSPDHYFDFEDLQPLDLKPANLSHFRYEFLAQLANARTAHPKRFPPIDPAKDADHTRALIGLLPWTITEYYAKLKSQFSYLKAYEADGTPEEIANAQQNIIYTMGVMGHFVGDGAQPLHTTRHHHGWVGPNPRGFATNYSFHAWIDGGFFEKAGLNRAELLGRVRPAKPLWPAEPKTTHADVFPEVVIFLVDQHQMVEPLYELQQKGLLSGEGDVGKQGRAFLAGQMLKAAQFLGDLWLTASEQTTPDGYLRAQLAKRKATRDNPTPVH